MRSVHRIIRGRLMKKQPDLEGILEKSMMELQAKTLAQMNGWGIHKPGHWGVDLSSRLLVFSFNDGKMADCRIQVIGTFSTITNTWLWSWANPQPRIGDCA